MAVEPETAHSFVNDVISVISLLALRSPGGVLAVDLKDLLDTDGVQMECENDGRRLTFKVVGREGVQ